MKWTYKVFISLIVLVILILIWLIPEMVILKIATSCIIILFIILYWYLHRHHLVEKQKLYQQKDYEISMLHDQLKGYKKIAKALREQKHEFQNKSHVILGLIRMNELDKASEYIMQNVYTTNLTSDYYLSRIKDDQISALFVGKEVQAVEQNLQIRLTNDSYLSQHHQGISSDDLIVVIGNLIDNSIDAYQVSKKPIGVIEVHVFEDEKEILIRVTDEAGGIKEEIKDKIFERGVTTKAGDTRGTGLALVRSIIEYYGGYKKIDTSNIGATMTVVLPKEN
ncbi:MAG: sensor histidine kinase [Candidatus Izemoplasmataceae bacterium]